MQQQHNNNALQAIKRYGQSLLSFIRKRVKTDADAEDILQDVWYQFSAMVNNGPVEQTGAWLYKVARNKITDKYRKHTETLLDDLILGGDEDDDDDNGYKADMLMTNDTTPETDYLRSLVWDELFAALDELPEEQRQVFIWHELDDIPFQEIADNTGINIQTLVSRKRYAVMHLRKRLKQLYDDITKY